MSAGDIVFARTGATTGKSYLIRSCPEAVFASYLIRLKPNEAVVPELMIGFFQSAKYWEAISENVAGNAQPNCNASKLSEIELPLPPLAEQQRIVAALEAILAKVANCQARLANVPTILRRFRQSVLAAACSGRLTADWRSANSEHSAKADFRTLVNEKAQHTAQGKRVKSVSVPINDPPDEMPATWEWTSLDQITSLITKGSSPKWQGFDYQSDGIPFVRSQNVHNGFMDCTDLVYLSPEFNDEHQLSIIQEGDILLNLVGASIGRAAIAPRNINGANCNQAVGIIRAMKSGLVNSYLKLWLLAPYTQDHIHNTKADVARANFNLDDVRPTGVALPPLSEQQEIVRRVDALFAVADGLEARYQNARQHVDRLTQSVLAKAFRGELVPTEHALATTENRPYEPASTLLERIQATQTTNGAAKPKARRTRKREAK